VNLRLILIETINKSNEPGEPVIWVVGHHRQIMKKTIVTYDRNGTKVKWLPTTIDRVGKDEMYLESVLAETPELLHLESRKTGIYGPFAVFRQLTFTTPQSRQIRPDILFLTASGDVVVVEVKLSTNPELRDRRVIAQAIDYTASLSVLSDKELAQLFSRGEKDDFFSLVHFLFPEEKDHEELSNTLLGNVKSGNIHIVVACDKVPLGLYELAKSVSVQSVLSFSLNIIEITPFLANHETSTEIMFVPNTRLATEIVARTAITVSSPQGSPIPTVNIKTTSLDEIEENIATTSRNERVSTGTWYAVDGLQGVELPTLYERCIKGLRQHGSFDVVLKKGIKAEEKISLFKNHRRYLDYTTQYEVTPEEWEIIFMSIRSARPMGEDNSEMTEQQ